MDSSLIKDSDTKTSADKTGSYLVLGTDTGALGHTDTIMVMMINPNKKTMKLILCNVILRLLSMV